MQKIKNMRTKLARILLLIALLGIGATTIDLINQILEDEQLDHFRTVGQAAFSMENGPNINDYDNLRSYDMVIFDADFVYKNNKYNVGWVDSLRVENPDILMISEYPLISIPRSVYDDITLGTYTQADLDSNITYRLCYDVYNELGNSFIIDDENVHSYTSEYNVNVSYVMLDISSVHVRGKIISHLKYLYDYYSTNNVISSVGILASDFYTEIPDYELMTLPSITNTQYSIGYDTLIREIRRRFKDLTIIASGDKIYSSTYDNRKYFDGWYIPNYPYDTWTSGWGLSESFDPTVPTSIISIVDDFASDKGGPYIVLDTSDYMGSLPNKPYYYLLPFSMAFDYLWVCTNDRDNSLGIENIGYEYVLGEPYEDPQYDTDNPTDGEITRQFYYEGDIGLLSVTYNPTASSYEESGPMSFTIQERDGTTHEHVSTIADVDPPVLSSLSVGATYVGQGDEVILSVNASSSEESIFEITYTYTSSYTDYLDSETDHYIYKTAANGTFSFSTQNYLESLEEYSITVGPRCYHSDNISVSIVATDRYGNSSVSEEIYNDEIDIPIVTELIPNLQTYDVSGINFLGPTLDVSNLNLDQISKFNLIFIDLDYIVETETQENWVDQVRNYPDSRNFGVVAFETTPVVWDSTNFPIKKRLYNAINNLYLTDPTCVLVDINGDVVKPYIEDDILADSYIINLGNSDARQLIIDFYIDEFNHSENRSEMLGILFDNFEYYDDVDLFLNFEIVNGREYIDQDLDGTPLDMDEDEQLLRRTSRLLFIDELRSAITSNIGEEFLIGVNSSIAPADSLLMSKLDILFIQDFQYGEYSDNGYGEYPYYNALTDNYQRSIEDYPEYCLIDDYIPFGEIYAGFNSLIPIMRDTIGPFIITEHSSIGSNISNVNPVYSEVFSLLFDNQFPVWGDSIFVDARRFAHPSDYNYNSLYSIGNPSSEINFEELPTNKLYYSREYVNGLVEIVLSDDEFPEPSSTIELTLNSLNYSEEDSLISLSVSSDIDSRLNWKYNKNSEGYSTTFFVDTLATDFSLLLDVSEFEEFDWVKFEINSTTPTGGISNTIIDSIMIDMTPSFISDLVSIAGDSQVELNWTSSDDLDFDSYLIYRGVISGNTSLYDEDIITNSYTDNNSTNDSTYYYTVAVSDTSGKISLKSNEVFDTPEASGGDPPGGGELVPSTAVFLYEGSVAGSFSADFTISIYDSDRNLVVSSNTLTLVQPPASNPTEFTFTSSPELISGETYYITITSSTSGYPYYRMYATDDTWEGMISSETSPPEILPIGSTSNVGIFGLWVENSSGNLILGHSNVVGDFSTLRTVTGNNITWDVDGFIAGVR